jgi:hypothetical protein
MFLRQQHAHGMSHVYRQKQEPTTRVYTPSMNGFERFMYEMLGLLPGDPRRSRRQTGRNRQGR